MSGWGSLLSKLLDVLAPPACTACDSPNSDALFCATCGVPSALPDVTSLAGVPFVVVGRYAAPLSVAITRFKYADRPELARPLARLLVPRLAQLNLAPDAVLAPVPLHRQRLAVRGYNQAALLAQELGKQSHRRCHARLLERLRDTPRQVGQGRQERGENVEGAFRVRRACAHRVVLVDDVVTTGSTVRACAHALFRAGVQLTAVVALARAEHC